MERGIKLIGCGQAPVHKCKYSPGSGSRTASTISWRKRGTDSSDWHDILEMIENNTIDPTIVLTHRYQLDDIAKVYHLQEKREGGLVKCFVETRFSSQRADGTPELTRLS